MFSSVPICILNALLRCRGSEFTLLIEAKIYYERELCR